MFIYFIFVFLFFAVYGVSSIAQNLDEDDIKLNNYIGYIKNDLKYFGVQIISFKMARYKMALSAVYKTKADYDSRTSPRYSAELDDKGEVYFRIYGEKCGIVDKIVDAVIDVNNQRVSANYYCTNEATGPHTIYSIKNINGNAFVNGEFSNRKYVFVEFIRSHKMVFDTDGFSEASKDKARPIY